MFHCHRSMVCLSVTLVLSTDDTGNKYISVAYDMFLAVEVKNRKMMSCFILH